MGAPSSQTMVPIWHSAVGAHAVPAPLHEGGGVESPQPAANVAAMGQAARTEIAAPAARTTEPPRIRYSKLLPVNKKRAAVRSPAPTFQDPKGTHAGGCG